ncbi:MAG: NfeD family protein [Phycisphaeraceae bacterium]
MAGTTRRRVLAFALVVPGLIGALAGPGPARDAVADAATAAVDESSPPAAAQPPVRVAAPISGLASGAYVAVVPIRGDIYGFTLDSLKRRVNRALQGGATLIVVELDTYGGTLRSALEISKYLKKVPVPTVAWVNDKAYSAGTLIASACSQIVMSPASTIGDCAPIVPNKEMSLTERNKALSPLVAEFLDNAVMNGHPGALLHATCEWGVVVYEVEHQEIGRRQMVNQLDYEVMVEGADPNTVGKGGVLKKLFGKHEPVMLKVTVATNADRRQWELVRRVHNGKSLLTLSQSEATEYGLSQADDILTDAQLQQHLAAASVTRVNQTWSETLAGWLVHPYARIVLIIALLLGAYMEFQSPGLGLPGAVAVLALLGLVCPPFIVGLAEIWHIFALVIGIGLLLAEVFVTPGFGVLGITGIVLIFTGLVFSVVPTTGTGPFPLPAPEMWGRLQLSLLSIMIAVAVSLVGFIVLSRYFGSIPILNRLILRSPPRPPKGVDQVVSGDEVIGQGRISVGDAGRVVTRLRPTGRATFNGQIVDVVSVGDWIDTGQPVRVVEVHGNRIVVETDR